MKSVKTMLLGLAIILLGISFGMIASAGIAAFAAAMFITVPIGFIVTVIGFVKNDSPM